MVLATNDEKCMYTLHTHVFIWESTVILRNCLDMILIGDNTMHSTMSMSMLYTLLDSTKVSSEGCSPTVH